MHLIKIELDIDVYPFNLIAISLLAKSLYYLVNTPIIILSLPKCGKHLYFYQDVYLPGCDDDKANIHTRKKAQHIFDLVDFSFIIHIFFEYIFFVTLSLSLRQLRFLCI